ncbi:GNAT family N-acetyltransferase [Priestia taiwanensis]|uniref:Acetyltransferase n=1 Tax=Priestia taiwanensis TaxID=1347902 RepID=A0A917AT60_9BACI|nr:GNAT family N-acetyltransferase [Priestia taiwanensis]MBM7363202.1 putative acetyltransferase [Priestia taiwanensis]GGE68492.1 acetyltransferase [Priestia taiwanensis]
MAVIFKQVQQTEKEILRNLYSFYLHDLSQFTSSIQIGEDGSFHYEDLEMFWDTEGITPYFLKVDERIAGFLLLLERPFLTRESDFSINDIFILNQYKGKGFGRQAVEWLFKEKRGKYVVVELQENTPAVSFWRKLYNDLQIEVKEAEENIDGERCFVQRFEV